ncbi:MAG TPA: hypothetical protein VJ928_04225 [Marivita sp.]|nr:hypothetical protein [Marivita sp.]
MDFTTLKKTRVAALCALLGLAACGDSLGEQALGGGVVGAGVSAATGGDVATGAAVGAAGNVAFCQTYPTRC